MDPEHLGRLIDEHSCSLELYARQWGDDAADSVQVAFMKLIQETPAPDNIRAWLFRVVRRLSIDQHRSNRRRQDREHLASSPENWFESDLENAIDGKLATAELKRLAPESREVVVARIWGELSFEEIAELAGVSSSTAHRRYHEGIAEIRERLGIECPTKIK